MRLNDTDTIYSVIANRNGLQYFTHLNHIRTHTVPDHSIDTSFEIQLISIALRKQSKYTQYLNEL